MIMKLHKEIEMIFEDIKDGDKILHKDLGVVFKVIHVTNRGFYLSLDEAFFDSCDASDFIKIDFPKYKEQK